MEAFSAYTSLMADTNLFTYLRSDVTNSTDLRVCGNRSLAPRGVLIHTTSGTSSLSWLQGGSADAGNPASADALIGRQGSQYLITPPGHFAYHAGRSTFVLDAVYSGDTVSQALLGIELECLDIENPTFEQYDSLSDLIIYYAGLHGWRWPFIILGHYAVARPLGRRSDPVNFDWGWLMGRLYVRSLAAQIPGLV